MITHVPFKQLGKANHGWLKSNHHFSFANYYNPKRMGFGVLRVINDDWVASGTGFPAHPHRNMEIISFIRSGAIHHKDSIGNKGITHQGEVQVMSAGKGITHSEYNLSKQDLTFYQIWIETNAHNIKPRWDTKRFPDEVRNDKLPLLISGFAEDSGKALFINQKARIYGGKISKGAIFEHNIDQQVYVLASQGGFEISDKVQVINMRKGDGAEVTKSSSITIKALENSEILIIDVPSN